MPTAGKLSSGPERLSRLSMLTPAYHATANPSAGLWQDGWYTFARRLPSPNFGERPAGVCIDLVVLHSISLPPGEYGGGHVQELFTNQLDWDAHPYFDSIRDLKVSAHFFIARDGQLWQFVSCLQRAWHAGASTYRGKSQCNDDSIGIELEGLEGLTFETAQYDTLASLSAALMQAFPIAHLAGHEHVAPGRKIDPGSGFEWQRLRSALGLGPAHFPPGV